MPIEFSAEQTKSNPQLQKLQESLQQTRESTILTEAAKGQQQFNLIRNFIMTSPAQMTPEFARDLSRGLSGMQEAVGQFYNEYKGFIVRNFHPSYWSGENVKAAYAARSELESVMQTMGESLGRAAVALERYAELKEGKKPSAEIAALAPAGYKAPTAASFLEDALSAMNDYAAASVRREKPLEDIGKIFKEVQHVEENTKTFGMILAGTSIILTGMWLGGALGVGVKGAALLGAGDSILTAQSIKGISEGEWLTGKEAVLAIALGAGLGAGGHALHGLHALHAAKAGAPVAGAAAIAVEATSSASIRFITRIGSFAEVSAKPVARVVATGSKVGEVGEQAIGLHDATRNIERETVAPNLLSPSIGESYGAKYSQYSKELGE